MIKTVNCMYYSLSDLAKVLGVPLSTVWQRAYRRRIYPIPSVLPPSHSRRKMYTKAEYQAIVAEHGPASKDEATK